MNSREAIAAISTPYGKGGIAVIRISGDGAITAAERIFVPFGNKTLSETQGNRAVYGKIFYNGEEIDDGIATLFRAPHSFTGEDTVEISCHGGIILANSVLEAAISAGCRYADAGEFTKRAFLNGKISLSQAEAVIGLIEASSEEAIKLSAAQSRGVLSEKIEDFRGRLTEIIASVYAYIDYPDEDLTDMTVSELLEHAEELKEDMIKLRSTYKIGRAVCEGITTAIVGKPNTGKSSLLNKILGKERAIVTAIPGTTRDTVEETVNVGRVTLRLCDTAGIHTTEDIVEKIGVDRSKKLLREAELVLAVFDSGEELDDEDYNLIKELKDVSAEIIPIINKCDTLTRKPISLPKELGEPIHISALTGEGLETLYERISGLFVSEKIDYNTTPMISNARQNAALTLACEHMESAILALKSGFTQDIAGLDLELALGSLGELDGRTASSEITDCIFSRFCVGK